jgi:hypothetical protein
MQALAFGAAGQVGTGPPHTAVAAELHTAAPPAVPAVPAVAGRGWVRGHRGSLDRPIERSAAVQKDQGSPYRHQPRPGPLSWSISLWRQKGICWLKESHCLDERESAVAQVLERKNYHW